MADVERSVRIAFEGDDRISQVIDSINGKLDSFAGSVRGVTEPLAAMSAAVLKAEASLAAFAIGGIVLAVNEAGKFDTVFREITTLFEAAPADVDGYRNALLNFATSSLSPLDQVGKATYEAISAGIDWTKSIEFMTQAEQLNVAGKGNLEATTKLLAGALNAYGDEVTEVGDYNDVLFQGVKLGNITLQDLSSSLGQVIGIAAGAKVPFDSLVAAVSALTSYGVPAEQAITGIKAAIAGIISPTDQARQVAKDLGIEFNAESLASKGLSGTLMEVYSATGGNVDQMFKLFGRVEALNAAILLGQDTSGKYAQALDLMANRAGVTQVAYEKMAASWDSVNQKIVNSLKATLIEVGTPLLDEYAKIGAGITGIFTNLRVEVNQGTFDPVIDLIEQFGADLAEDLKKIAANMPEALAGVDWTKLTDSIKSLGTSIKELFEAFFGDIDLTTVDGLQKGIQKIVDGITALTNTTAGILQSWKPFVELLGKAASEFANLSPEAQTSIGNVLGFGQAVDKILSNVDIFTGSIKFLGGAIALLGATQIPSAIAGFASLAPAIAGAASALGPFAAVAAALGAGWVLDKVLDATLPKWEENKQAIADNIATMHGADVGLDELSAAITDTGEEVESQKSIWDELSEAIDAIPEQATTEIEAKGVELTKEEIDGIVKAFAEIGEEKTVEVTAVADEPAIEKVGNIIVQTFPDGRVVLVQAQADQSSLDKANSAINTALPESKIMEIKLQGEIDIELAKIQAQAQNLDSYFKYKAEVDVAEVQAVFKMIETQSTNIAEMFKNTGDVLEGLAGSLADVGAIGRLEIFELMEQESARRDALLAEQIKLSEAQIKYLDARAKAMQSGQGIITVNAEGLQPELELVLQKIIELAQIRANEEGLSFLLGAV